jgi:putative ABC transport system ATP-binding protein
VIALANVSKIYHTEEMDTYALSGINIHIDRGDFISILGPSGGGKSTLLSILAMHDRPTSGSYLFDGILANSLSPSRVLKFRRENMGYIFQDFNLIDELTVEENIELPLRAMGQSKKQMAIRVDELLEQVDLAGRKRHYPIQLSGGQQQRVAIARALANKPKIIFADEPTGNLDSTNSEIVMNLIAKAHVNGATICMVTHNSVYAESAQRVVSIRDGKLQEES